MNNEIDFMYFVVINLHFEMSLKFVSHYQDFSILEKCKFHSLLGLPG